MCVRACVRASAYECIGVGSQTVRGSHFPKMGSQNSHQVQCECRRPVIGNQLISYQHASNSMTCTRISKTISFNHVLLHSFNGHVT